MSTFALVKMVLSDDLYVFKADNDQIKNKLVF